MRYEVLKGNEGSLVSIVIPVYNKLKLTKRCIEMILKNPPSIPFEIIIVDDYSQDNTGNYLAYLSRHHSFIKVLKNDRNLGFSASCNRGALVSRGDYIAFLNNDTVTLPGWLEALMDVSKRSRDIGIVGAKLLYPNGTIQHAGVLFRNYPFPITPFHIYAGKPADLPDANIERDYDVVTAACMLVRKECFEKMGGFDERFINGYEDVDFCLRARTAGYRVVYTPKSVLYHLESSSPGRFDHSIPNLRILHNRWMGKVRYVERREPRVSVIIVNYNGWDDTVDSLSSLFMKEQYERFNIIVVDNGSTEDRSAEIESLCKRAGRLYIPTNRIEATSPRFEGEVFFVKLTSNKGFGGGSNEGIRMALSWNADYVWLLNNDTIIGDHALYFLISVAEFLPQVAIVGSKLHCYPDTEKIQFDGVSVSYHGKITVGGSSEIILNVQFVSGASMLIRSDFLRTHGLLEEDYFLYFEDNEICLRAIRNGFMVLYNPLSVVYHKGGASIGDFMGSSTSIYYGIRNSLFFYEEWNKKRLEETLSLVENSLVPRIISYEERTRLEAVIQAINDFLLDKKGSREEGSKNDRVEYTSLFKHLFHLSETLLKNPARIALIKTYFDTVRTLVDIRLRKAF
ncbi:MAG: glycosyltransferase [Syntrophobacterales bacterium]|nr:glycosyltransferase [Syntrophobacterales bacterium]